MKNKKIFNQLIDSMMNEQNHNPRDYCFKYIVQKYPKAVHDAFDFPGEYVDNLKVDVLTNNNRNLTMDCTHMVMPKGDIVCQSTINVEHQDHPLTDEEIESIYEYKLFMIYKTGIPSHTIIMTNDNRSMKQEMIYSKTHSMFFQIHTKVVTYREISKRLTILKDTLKNKRTLPQKEAMYFPYIAIFAEEKYSKKIMVELSKLFSQITCIEPSIELDIHQVLKKMIKECFHDDEDKCKELLTMISKSIFQKNLEGLTYKERAEIEMADLNQRLELRDYQLEQKDQQIVQITQQKDQQIEQKDQQLEQKDQQIVQITQEKDLQLEQAENENNELRKEIDQLKKQLSKG